METGQVLTVGTPQAVLDDPAVIEAYLGGDPAAVQRSAAPVPALASSSPMTSDSGA